MGLYLSYTHRHDKLRSTLQSLIKDFALSWLSSHVSSCSYPHLLLTVFTDSTLAPGTDGLHGGTLNPTKSRGLVWCGMWVW
jgi:hypothetical protein